MLNEQSADCNGQRSDTASDGEHHMDMKVALTSERIAAMRAEGHWTNRLLLEDLERKVGSSPDAPAIVEYRSAENTRVELSYRELADRAEAIAGHLARRGIVHGDVVSYILPNWWQAVAI